MRPAGITYSPRGKSRFKSFTHPLRFERRTLGYKARVITRLNYRCWQSVFYFNVEYRQHTIFITNLGLLSFPAI